MLIDGSWSVAVVGQNFTPKPKLSRKVWRKCLLFSLFSLAHGTSSRARNDVSQRVA
jgi:hypothetical protein